MGNCKESGLYITWIKIKKRARFQETIGNARHLEILKVASCTTSCTRMYLVRK